MATMSNNQDPPFIILLGDVGTGKSTVVEKLTGEKRLSNDTTLSFTRTADPYYVYDGSMIICDTPGSNAIQNKLSHNMEIAAAMNIMPVSRLLLIVKAETRIDNVIDGVRKYAERLLDLPMNIIGVLVTHMDTVSWTREEFMPHIVGELGIDSVVFSGFNVSATKLLSDLHNICLPHPHALNIDHENFLRIFKINNNHFKILQCTNREVADFKALKKQFDERRREFSDKDLVDLMFEFQAWMGQQILLAQKRMANENNFTFLGEDAANEAGHIANMTNQLRLVLHYIRLEAAGFQSEHGVGEARRCPHCNLVWMKIAGCDGNTTCGNRPSTVIDVRDPSFGVLGTFTFKWIGNFLDIIKSGTKTLETKDFSSSHGIGCGNTINWSQMPRVDLPNDLREVQVVATDDVKMMPDSLPGASNWNEKIDDDLALTEFRITKNIKRKAFWKNK